MLIHFHTILSEVMITNPRYIPSFIHFIQLYCTIHYPVATLCAHYFCTPLNFSQINTQVKQIVDSVEMIKQRVTVRDYLQPNDSCPTFKQGLSHFQYVGPENEFSKCYYLEPPPKQRRYR